MLPSGKPSGMSQPFLNVLQASISKFVYIQQISENTEHIFFVLLSVKLRLKWMNKLQILVCIACLEIVPTFMEMGLVDSSAYNKTINKCNEWWHKYNGPWLTKMMYRLCKHIITHLANTFVQIYFFVLPTVCDNGISCKACTCWIMLQYFVLNILQCYIHITSILRHVAC